jgi:hypothetical protein
MQRAQRMISPQRHGDTECMILLSDREITIRQKPSPFGQGLVNNHSRRRRGGFAVPQSPGTAKDPSLSATSAPRAKRAVRRKSPQRRKGRGGGVSFPWPGDSGQGKIHGPSGQGSFAPRSMRIFRKFVYQSYDALSHNGDVKIQEQTQTESRQLQVCQHLSFVNRLDRIA